MSSKSEEDRVIIRAHNLTFIATIKLKSVSLPNFPAAPWLSAGTEGKAAGCVLPRPSYCGKFSTLACGTSAQHSKMCVSHTSNGTLLSR